MAGEKKYSYIKKAFAKNGFYSFFLALFSFLLLLLAMALSFSHAGQSGMNTGAIGLFSLLIAGMSLWFTVLSFRESGRNYLFARIGGILSGGLLLIWLGILIAGLGI